MPGPRPSPLSSGVNLGFVAASISAAVPGVVKSLRAVLPVASIVDAEVVALDADGRPRVNLR